MDGKVFTSFGIIADIQYADVQDGYNYSKTRKRFYRRSLDILRHALTKWNEQKISHVFQLGDVVDGKAKKGKKSEDAVNAVLDVCRGFDGEVYHIWGNHELYNFSREWLMNSPLCSAKSDHCVSPDEGRSYYYRDLGAHLRVIALDTYEISLLGIDHETTQYRQLYTELRKKNKNKDMNSPEGLYGSDQRYVLYNGGCSAEQLDWLHEVCTDAEKQKRNVVVVGHCSVYEKSSDKTCLCWTGDDVMRVLANHKDCVICYMAGHDHAGGHAVDDAGILHITMPGVIEAEDMECYATAVLYQNELKIEGCGTIPSHTISLKYPCI